MAAVVILKSLGVFSVFKSTHKMGCLKIMDFFHHFSVFWLWVKNKLNTFKANFKSFHPHVFFWAPGIFCQGLDLLPRPM